jgi:hypothetical protein
LDGDLSAGTVSGVRPVDGSGWLVVALRVTVLEGVDLRFEADSIGTYTWVGLICLRHVRTMLSVLSQFLLHESHYYRKRSYLRSKIYFFINLFSLQSTSFKSIK